MFIVAKNGGKYLVQLQYTTKDINAQKEGILLNLVSKLTKVLVADLLSSSWRSRKVTCVIIKGEFFSYKGRVRKSKKRKVREK